MRCPECHNEGMNLVCIETVICHYPIGENNQEIISEGEVSETIDTSDSFIQCHKCFKEFGYRRDNDGSLIAVQVGK